PKSMSTKPAVTKSVHFYDQVGEILTFSPLDSPLSLGTQLRSIRGDISKEGKITPHGIKSSPKLEIVTPNFTQRTSFPDTQCVIVQRLQLTDDEKLQGFVAVRNLAFQKSVICRFTFDNWITLSDISAIYKEAAASEKIPPGYDLFVFTLELSDILHLESKTVQ
ncbi:putative phosphatase regulatory subunit-domain-containing protein, partial [Mariannaea sp. PMI_226]